MQPPDVNCIDNILEKDCDYYIKDNQMRIRQSVTVVLDSRCKFFDKSKPDGI